MDRLLDVTVKRPALDQLLVLSSLRVSPRDPRVTVLGTGA